MPSVTLLTLPGCYELRGRLLLLACAISRCSIDLRERDQCGKGVSSLRVGIFQLFMEPRTSEYTTATSNLITK